MVWCNYLFYERPNCNRISIKILNYIDIEIGRPTQWFPNNSPIDLQRIDIHIIDLFYYIGAPAPYDPLGSARFVRPSVGSGGPFVGSGGGWRVEGGGSAEIK